MKGRHFLRNHLTVDYDAIADSYARNRKASDQVIAELRAFSPLTRASRVLEVGCGTANHISALVDAIDCGGWGIEPSDAMREHARVRGQVSVSKGTAECIPYEDGFFDLLFSVDVIHYVPSPRNHFEESFRVLRSGGWICTFTDSTEMIRSREPLSRYWPASAKAEIRRYHTVETLLASMGEAGLTNLTRREIKRESRVTDSSPYREKAYSCLRLISDAEYEEGLRWLEDDLKKGPVLKTSEYVCIWGMKPQ
jgi:ubiquinone/menaquinone biosynthesis C-methylase UbiE